MAVKQLQDVYNFRKTRLTCHKWKADTTKLKGIGEANDPDKGVGEADDPDKGVGEADNPNKADDPDEGVGEADDPDEVVGKADEPNEADNPDERVGKADGPVVALLGLHVCIYKEISCAPCLVLIKKTPTMKGFQKIRS